MTASDMRTAHGMAWVQHRGDSLAPVISPGEWVQIDANVTAFSGPGIYLTAWKDFQPKPHHPVQVPQLRHLDYIDGVLHSVSPNPVIPPIQMDVTTMQIGGKVVEH